MTKLTKTQREALIAIYAPHYNLCVKQQGDFFGESPKTLQSLVRKGLVVLQDERDLESAAITDAGRRALGLSLPPPTKLKEAVVEAVEALLPYTLEEDDGAFYEFGDAITPTCVDEDWATGSETWTDTDQAIAAILDPLVESGFFDEIVDAAWDAIAGRVSECGFPVHVERFGAKVYLLKPDA